MAGISELTAILALAASISSQCGITPTSEAPERGSEAPASAPIKRPARPHIPVPIEQPDEVLGDPVVCYEDQPCWDCSTMGNLICGRADEGGVAVDWHSTWTLFEDGSGVNADGVVFCVWHTAALCGEPTPVETVPPMAQLEFEQSRFAAGPSDNSGE